MSRLPHQPRLGFVGVGWIGRQRLESVLNAGAAQIAAVFDPTPENAAAVRTLVPDVTECSSLEELCRETIDGLVIATPSALHAEQAVYSLKRGIPVFCQKPLARTGDEVNTVVEASRRADRLLAVDMSYRHTRGLLAIRDLVQRNVLGHVFAANLVFHNAYGPGKSWFYDRALSGGGCVIDLGIHLVDAALWILSSDVADVSGFLAAEGHALSPNASEIEDYASVRLRMECGTVVNLACSWKMHAGQDAVIEASFYGTNGGASFRNVNGSFTEFCAEHFIGTKRQVLTGPPDPWGAGAILAWVQSLQASNRFRPEIEEHVAVAKVLDRIYGEQELTSFSL
jgi:predicted dehydrogenase